MSNIQRPILTVTASILCAMLLAAPVAAKDMAFSEAALVDGGVADGTIYGETATGDRDIQETMWFQGFLADVDTGDPINGTVDITAEILDAAAAGTNIWGPEPHNGVIVTEGWFNIELGSTDALPNFDDPPYYLELTIDSETMDARQKLASVPMAYHAATLDLPFEKTIITGIDPGFRVIQEGTGPGIAATKSGGGFSSAIYARSYDIGAAICGYGHSSGSAIKGETHGSGLAGNFIGDVNVTGDLTCNGFQFTASPTLGHVLTSDTFGNGVWQAPAGGSDSDWTIDGNDMYTEITGNLGIGTSGPTKKVHIVGAGHDDLLFETTADWGSVEFVGKTSAGTNDYLTLTKYGPSAAGTVDGIAVAGKGLVASGTSSDGLLVGVMSSDPMYFLTSGDEQMRLTSDGYLGIGTTTPDAQLEVWRNTTGIVFESVSNSIAPRINRIDCNANLDAAQDLLELEIGSGSSSTCQFIECEISPSDVKFRVNGNGEVTADGSFTGGGADLAEMIAVSAGAHTAEPGDVMVIDTASKQAVAVAWEARSALVVGIYSTKPGFVASTRDWDKQGLEEAGSYTMDEMAEEFDEIPLAVIGIVPCKGSAENGPIAVGDLLVTSGTPGHAMRDSDPAIGTVLGKALEPLAGGTGVIKVIVTLQ